MTKSHHRGFVQSAPCEGGVIAIERPGIQVRFFLVSFLFSSHLSIIALCVVHLISNNHCILILEPASLPLPTVFLPRTTAMSASGSGAPNAGSGSSSFEKKQFPRVDLRGNNLPPSPAPSSPHGGRRYNIATELVFTEGNDQYNASSVPIYQVRSTAKHLRKDTRN
jgi:hypothetical protein